MKWLWTLPQGVLALLTVSLDLVTYATEISDFPVSHRWSPQRKLDILNRTRDLWYHGFDNYMRYAFPLDELTPLSCSGQGPDWGNPQNIAANDVAGNFSLTLVDVLDTFIILNDMHGFENAVKNVITWVSFDVNTKPQVFETTIRVMGGLLSAHIFASDPNHPFYLTWYQAELLNLAYDLGRRLLPAFSTPTGLPYARINLRKGIVKGETLETCTAGAGSLILEFATLSRLTGDSRFEKAAHKAFFALWNRRSDIGLVGNTINTWTGDWTTPEITGIGAGIDSFYEYALKWYILSGDVEFLDVWDDAYSSIMRYARSLDGFTYRVVNMRSGEAAYNIMDSLSAFWPGLQVLAGDVESAVKLHLLYYNIWRKYSGLPEVYDASHKQATSHQYPLRPEFIESTWYLYRATKDPFYLDVGERVLFDIVTRSKVPCGLTGISDLRTNKRDDRMESFALSETLKYLYLLFDEENPLNHDDSNYVFTTEGHILKLDRSLLKPISAGRRQLRKIEDHQCPEYPISQTSPTITTGARLTALNHGTNSGVYSRTDADYVRELVSLTPNDKDIATWSPDGRCERPKLDIFSYDFIMSTTGKRTEEDLSPSRLKLSTVHDGYILHDITGIRAHVVKRLDGKGYDVRKLGHYTVRPGQLVYVNDTSLAAEAEISNSEQRDPELLLRIQLDTVVDSLLFFMPADHGYSWMPGLDEGISITAYTSLFGGNPSPRRQDLSPRFVAKHGTVVLEDDTNSQGCSPYIRAYENATLVVERGGCTFLQKLLMAQAAQAAGILVINNEDVGLNPTASRDELAHAGDIDDMVLLVLTQSAGAAVKEFIDVGKKLGINARLFVEAAPQATIPESEAREDTSPRILYLNGHGLLNTRLLI